MSLFLGNIFGSLIVVVVGYIFALLTGLILNRLGVQGYPWDNLTIVAVLFAILVYLAGIARGIGNLVRLNTPGK